MSFIDPDEAFAPAPFFVELALDCVPLEAAALAVVLTVEILTGPGAAPAPAPAAGGEAGVDPGAGVTAGGGAGVMGAEDDEADPEPEDAPVGAGPTRVPTPQGMASPSLWVGLAGAVVLPSAHCIYPGPEGEEIWLSRLK